MTSSLPFQQASRSKVIRWSIYRTINTTYLYQETSGLGIPTTLQVKVIGLSSMAVCKNYKITLLIMVMANM